MHGAIINELREENTKLSGENVRLEERLRRHDVLEDGDDGDCAEKGECL
jgi:hypothetical protein